MKKTLIVLGCLSLGLAHAQHNGRDHAQHQTPDTRVGINTEKPVATLELKKVDGLPATQVQGFLLPHLTKEERDAMEKEALVNGLMIFNTTKNCIDWWDGSKWACTDGSKVDRPAPIMPATTPIALPNGITLENGMRMIASLYDTDYLPYELPTSLATWETATNITADGQAEAKTIDVQGKVTTTGLEVYIPVKATASGNLPAYKTYTHIPAERTQDGVERILELSWATQAFSNNTKSIKATIKAIEGDLNVKKLDLKGGLGSDYNGLELATFAIPQSVTDGNLPANYKGKFELRAISGIPDKNFANETIVNGENKGYLHQFIYLPVQGPDGKLWLNNNLGADYANINSPHFDPAKQAETPTDYKAYGSLFQFGRDGDGHELVNWVRATSGSPTIPQMSWTSDQSTSLVNNILKDPCPDGWRLPTRSDFDFVGARYVRVQDADMYTFLALTYTGWRYNSDGRLFYNQGTRGVYRFSTSMLGSYADGLIFDAGGYSTDYSHTASLGWPVRCVQQ